MLQAQCMMLSTAESKILCEGVLGGAHRTGASKICVQPLISPSLKLNSTSTRSTLAGTRLLMHGEM